MNSRERVLLYVVLGLVVAVACGSLAPFLYFKPRKELRARREALEKSIEDKKAQIYKERTEIKKIEEFSPRLASWQQISLPEPDLKKEPKLVPDVHMSRMQIAYQSYLTDLLSRSGFRANVIRAGKFDNKATPTYTKNKPIYGTQTFTVEGQGNVQSIIKMFERLHNTPLLHQVKNFSILKPRTAQRGQKPDDLDVKLTIEVLQVVGAEKRTALLPSFDEKKTPPVVLATKKREYDHLVARNPFYPPAPVIERPTQQPTETVEEKPKERKADVLAFVRLTMISRKEGRRWEALLRDLNKKDERITLDPPIRENFVVRDRYDNEVLRGEVSLIEDRDVILKIEKKYYRLKVGQSLGQVWPDYPLKDSEAKELGLEIAPPEEEKSKESKDKDAKDKDAKAKETTAKDKAPSKTTGKDTSKESDKDKTKSNTTRKD